MVNQGPIPEGTYWINPQKIIYGLPRGSLMDFLNTHARNTIFGKSGKFPGGTRSWGIGRVDINPAQIDVGGVKRGDFSIHGGDVPGSAGCIDITGQDKNFFDFLEKHRTSQDSIPIFVKYPKEEIE